MIDWFGRKSKGEIEQLKNEIRRLKQQLEAKENKIKLLQGAKRICGGHCEFCAHGYVEYSYAYGRNIFHCKLDIHCPDYIEKIKGV